MRTAPARAPVTHLESALPFQGVVPQTLRGVTRGAADSLAKFSKLSSQGSELLLELIVLLTQLRVLLTQEQRLADVLSELAGVASQSACEIPGSRALISGKLCLRCKLQSG
jgi:hypothetical protein